MVYLKQIGKCETKQIVVMGEWLRINNGIIQVNSNQRAFLFSRNGQIRAGCKFEEIADMQLPENVKKPKEESPDKQSEMINTEDKFVSVITTTHDRDYALKNLIKSLKNQTYKGFEFICVGDGGKDMMEVLSSSGLDYKYIHISSNIGLYRAQVLGMKIARGDYICTIDDDDIYYPEALHAMIYKLEENKADVVFARCNRKSATNEKQVKLYPEENIEILSEGRMLRDNFNHASARMFHRRCFNKIGYPDDTIEFLGDWEYGIRLARNCKYIFTNDIVSEVVLKEDGMSMRNNTCPVWHKEAIDIVAKKGILKQTKDKPVLSLIIPLYKTTTWSKVTLWSSINCTLKYLNEIILVDDCSPEDEYENLKELIEGHANIKYLQTDKNRGISAALNLGLKHCRGDYVGFIGGDDELYAGHYDKLIDAIKGTNKVLAYGDGHILQPHGLEYGKQQEYNQKELMRHNYIAKFMIWRADLQERVGLFREDFKVALDWDMWIKLSLCGDFIHVPQILGAWRNRQGCAHKDYYNDCTKEIGIMMKQYGNNYKVNNDHTVVWT